MSYAVEVVADSSGKWCGNQLRFATKAEAEAYAKDLFFRWTLVETYRVVESPDPVRDAWVDGRAVRVEASHPSQ